MKTFIHLRQYSNYSLLESSFRINEIINICKEHHMPAIALTDKQNTKNVIQIIKDLVNHYNISFIVATHNLSIIKKFDKIVKLSEGKII